MNKNKFILPKQLTCMYTAVENNVYAKNACLILDRNEVRTAMKFTIDTDELLKQASKGAAVIGKKAGELKDSADKVKKDVNDKITELDRELMDSTTQYNDAYTQMNDNGIQLYVERCRDIDLIENVETLVNSIANRPKEFDKSFSEIVSNREQFKGTCDFAKREIQDARKAAGGAGAGLAAGASVAFMGPTAAMWIATTFGTASTGAAISTLTGAAASNAALAWLGGGALAAGGGGMAAGNALLALAGPVGWTIAGASLLGSIILFSKKKMQTNKEKSEEIERVKKNTESVNEMNGNILAELKECRNVRTELKNSWQSSLAMFNGDYTSFTAEQKAELGALVNNTRVLSVKLNEVIA
jgi:hypothetical protein